MRLLLVRSICLGLIFAQVLCLRIARADDVRFSEDNRQGSKIDHQISPKIKESMNHMWFSLLDLLERVEGNDGALDAADTSKLLTKLQDTLGSIKNRHERLESLSDTLRYAQISARSQDIDMTRFHLNSVINTCISCHVSSGVAGPEHKRVTAQLSLARQADIAFLVSDYAKAAELYYGLAAKNKQTPVDSYNFLVRYILIMLRPPQGDACVGAAKRGTLRKNLVRFASDSPLQGEIEGWLEQLDKLGADPVCKMHDEVSLSAGHLLSWLERGEDRGADKKVDETDSISLRSLRTFWYIKKVLAEISDERSWYVAGMFFSRFGGLSIEEHPEGYFARCINEGDKLKIKCFNGYRDYLYRIYTGSSGTHLPKEEAIKLLKLREIAKGSP